MSTSADPASAAYTFPAGQLGHLTPPQQAAFAEFKKLCTDKGDYKPGDPPSHDDGTLLRFLRARRFQIQPAYEQFSSVELYYKQNRLQELYEIIDIEEYEQTRRLYPQWIGRRDKRGLPITIFEIAKLDMKAVAANEKTDKLKGIDTSTASSPVNMLRLFVLCESFSRFVAPWHSALTDRPFYPTPLKQGIHVVDISGMGLKQYWYLKSHLQDSSALTAQNYPETLESIIVIGAPSFFSTVWAWIKRFIDPGVVSKIRILPSAPAQLTAALSELIDIKSIPKKYGGELDWEFGNMPNLEAGYLANFTWEGNNQKLPIGPCRWEEGENGEMKMVALGTKDGVPRREVLGRLDRKWKDVLYPTEEMVTQGMAKEGGPTSAST